LEDTGAPFPRKKDSFKKPDEVTQERKRPDRTVKGSPGDSRDLHLKANTNSFIYSFSSLLNKILTRHILFYTSALILVKYPFERGLR